MNKDLLFFGLVFPVFLVFAVSWIAAIVVGYWTIAGWLFG